MIFFSTYVYAFAKQHGSAWGSEFKRELREGPRSSLPCVRTYAAATAVDDCMLQVSGPSRIPQARSQSAGMLLRSPRADIWVCCDDDVEAGPDVIARLVRAARTTRGVVSAPCLQRSTDRAEGDPGILNIRMHAEPAFTHGDEFLLASITLTGFGLVALHRDGVQAIADQHPELVVDLDENGTSFPALFAEQVGNRKWYGEDNSFCLRANRAKVPIHALCSATVVHAGRRCELEVFEGVPYFRVHD